MVYKYGEFTDSQFLLAKENIRKAIFFLLLCVDRKTCDEYKGVNVPLAFDDLLYKIAGMNDILYNPPELVLVESLLQSALNEYLSPTFKYKTYRKLILDAGAEIMKVEG